MDREEVPEEPLMVTPPLAVVVLAAEVVAVARIRLATT